MAEKPDSECAKEDVRGVFWWIVFGTPARTAFILLKVMMEELRNMEDDETLGTDEHVEALSVFASTTATLSEAALWFLDEVNTLMDRIS